MNIGFACLQSLPHLTALSASSTPVSSRLQSSHTQRPTSRHHMGHVVHLVNVIRLLCSASNRFSSLLAVAHVLEKTDKESTLPSDCSGRQHTI